jgi:hypothetical protein
MWLSGSKFSDPNAHQWYTHFRYSEDERKLFPRCHQAVLHHMKQTLSFLHDTEAPIPGPVDAYTPDLRPLMWNMRNAGGRTREVLETTTTFP